MKKFESFIFLLYICNVKLKPKKLWTKKIYKEAM